MTALDWRWSTPAKEGAMRVSKWLKHQVLLDIEEMRALLQELDPFFICIASDAVVQDEALVSTDAFIQAYGEYVLLLKEGKIPDHALFRRHFSTLFTSTKDALYAVDVGKGKLLLKATKPVIQLQAHHFFPSTVDGKFYPMVLSQESVSWGIQFSYPQIYQDPHTHSFAKVTLKGAFPNTELFQKLATWLRRHTAPTSFSWRGGTFTSPLRLGKKCSSWIGEHPQLLLRGIRVLSLHKEPEKL